MPYNENQKKVKAPELPKSVICLCSHCEERFASNNGICAMFCKNCRTKEARQSLNAENDEIKKERLELNPQVV